jgi:hypothetical protein
MNKMEIAYEATEAGTMRNVARGLTDAFAQGSTQGDDL